MKNILVVFSVLGIIALSSAQIVNSEQIEENTQLLLEVDVFIDVIGPNEPVILTGQCDPNITVVQNLVIPSFMGQWHEIKSYYSENALGTCSRAQYTLVGDVVQVVNSQVINQTLFTISGTATVASSDGSAVLNVELNVLPGVTAQQLLYIIATDYDNYAILYSCENRPNNYKRVFSWVAGRTPTLSESAQREVQAIIDSTPDLNEAYYQDTPRSDEDCFYFPPVDTSQTVVFRGQCDESIPAVADFNPVRYMGLWHDIEAYPSPFQAGATCNNAFYTLRDGVVDVYNTQVINQTLDTINGEAVIDPTANGTGKLIVTFPVAGTNFNTSTNYWVLATDYDTYALVYSCTNLNNDSRAVFGWKLSRKKALPPAAATAITNAMANISVLDQRYFVSKNQSAEDCFYYPEPQVVFPGQCDESINVVSNFNAARYLGLWYNIQSYPQPFQDGSCPTATYSLGATGVDVYNTQVVNQTLDTITGVASLVDELWGGKLEVVFEIGGFNVTSPYWVLATDYDNYAFVYACTNLPGDRRSVSSWKLSRQNTLSNASETAINNIIDNIPVLRQEYYKIHDHSDEGCFYYPEPKAAKPVVFPGQCDSTIQVVSNFNLSRFVGTWNEIEAYPKEQQQGVCISHEFNEAPNNTLSLTNNQVLDRLLKTNEGFVRSADGSGKMELTIDVDNETIVMPYWVISTDYDNYALIYSCMNIDNSTRGVWSWKLSRSKTLSPVSNIAINNAMASIDVLDNRYYEPIPQSNRHCLYYPNITLNEPVIFSGLCDDSLAVTTQFSPPRYAGRWYDIESYYDGEVGSCTDSTYFHDGINFEITSSEVRDQQLYSRQRKASIAVDGTARFTFTENNETLTYNILATDYTSYSLVYSCINIDSSRRRVRAWKLSRERELTTDAQNIINNAIRYLDSVIIDNRYFSARDQNASSCFYYPEPVPGQAVLFRAQCDPNVQVVQNFNVTRYLGTWYDIEHYPQNFQRGTCPTAQYSLGENGVDVYNTEVVNQQLSSITGSAVLASQDGSAKLTVSFPDAGAPGFNSESPYWVLATNYDSYSLVYSCVNINEEYSRVTVWKLSRIQSLTPTAQTAINNAMDQVPVIRQQYFSESGHREQDCFTYPKNFGGPVILPGQCPTDNQVDVVNGFNADSFSGTWHEIARFPSEMQNGECGTTTTNTTSTNTLTITQSVVLNETLSQTTGTGTVSSNNRGVISAVLNNPNTGASFTTTLYVLATNYDEYALVYSCRNVDTTRKQIYSWKLSRSRDGLSAAATAAINEKVSSTEDLFEGYYENVDQSNDACFYYPEFDTPPEIIVLPGPCPESIRGIANFSAADYLGRWYEIASYPQRFQFGECSRAEYSLGSDGAVGVDNTQVINQTLFSQLGSAVVSSNDGTGLLTVTFVVNGVTNVANYYILATDYTDYALVYSCRNLDNGNRQVSSWKLSRSITLSAQADAVMNNTIRNTPGLLEDYYSPTSQTDEDCFYIPELTEEPPLFRGQCDTNITGVANFNISSYLGWWHEVERYPYLSSPDCTSSDFQNTASGVQVLDTGIRPGMNATYDRATVVATNNGKITKTYSDGRVVDIWVLATDYTSYSLLYMCENFNSEYRRVWSAKHSRWRSLNVTSNDAMAPVIAGNPVLVPSFYLPVNQSDSACFPQQSGQQVILPGQCDLNIPVVQNFDVAGFSGTWHEIARFPSEMQNGECGTTTMNATSTNTLTITQSVVLNETLSQATGTGTVSSNNRGVISAVLNNPNTGTSFATTLYVLDTNYNDYALVYSCRNVDTTRKQIYSWKLSRSRDGLSTAATAAIKEKVSSTEDLFEGYYEDVDQSNDACFHYPKFDTPPEIIVLPGPCPESIRGIANFSATDYLGRWYEIASYPQRFQFGECSRAEYSLGSDGAVVVDNTQVINQTLFTQLGSAVVSSNDGTGLLTVTFVVNGVTNVANYYILATDYTDYALVYSCRNLDNGNRQVSSWKLSRSRTLSDQANAVMNNTIQNTPGLLEEYYSPTSQTDEDCFYIPELTEEPPLFRGQCDTNITGVANFNISAYLGWWHEVERYPYSSSPDCTSSDFQNTASGVHVVDIGVRPGMNATYDRATVVATNNGKITKTYSDGRVVDIWVLATDYTSYSLLYMCVNVNNSEYRQVWSAKHSRSRSLTDTANDAMAPVIAGNPVLVPSFYLPVNQSDRACFHYPPQSGQQVILPGQCDLNIPVVQNFDVAGYSGTWYQIERYPQIFESGSCTGARYTIDEDVVNVLNWEVINGTLDTIEGTAVPTFADSSARLTVTLPIVGTNATTTTQLYVLTTDYSSYSLAYSCVEYDNYRRAIGAWKLSRERTMSSAGTAAINNYMATREELHQPYFLTVTQSEDCEEPSGSFVAKSSVIVILVCGLLQLLFK